MPANFTGTARRFRFCELYWFSGASEASEASEAASFNSARHSWIIVSHPPVSEDQRENPAKLQQLARIADTTGCKVCLSSNWRFYDELREYVYQPLDVLGIARIGTTPDAGEAESGEPKRPCEISAWMRAWNQGRRPKIQSFVAVDDRPLTEETGGAFLKGVHPDAHSIFHVSKPFALVWQVISSRPTRRPD